MTKMKAKELMIGDLVIAHIIANSDELRKPRITKVTGGLHEDGICDGGIHNYIDEEHIEPIPLTEEILLKNGFEKSVEEHKKTGKVRKVHSKTRYTLIQNPDTPMVNFISVSPVGKTTIKYHNKNGEWIKGINIRIKYVHELQHALRLCGLNELADNFKIQ